MGQPALDAEFLSRGIGRALLVRGRGLSAHGRRGCSGLVGVGEEESGLGQDVAAGLTLVDLVDAAEPGF